MSGPILELDGLSRSFGDRVAVDGLSFSVPAGSPVRVRRSQRCRQDDDDANHLRAAWRRTAAACPGAALPIDGRVRERIGYMPEERGLYPKMRLGDQLEYFAVLHGASHAAGAGCRAARGWSGWGWAIVSSRGWRRCRMATSSAFSSPRRSCTSPDLLILDEPFAGLDPIATDVMAEVLREQAARGVPVLFSSHQLELVEQLCEAVAIIDHGRLDRLR